MRVLLTGGCGFIGSAVIRHLLRHRDASVVNVDKMSYAASEDALEEARPIHGTRWCGPISPMRRRWRRSSPPTSPTW